jgi:hypothetical protein
MEKRKFLTVSGLELRPLGLPARYTDGGIASEVREYNWRGVGVSTYNLEYLVRFLARSVKLTPLLERPISLVHINISFIFTRCDDSATPSPTPVGLREAGINHVNHLVACKANTQGSDCS